MPRLLGVTGEDKMKGYICGPFVFLWVLAGEDLCLPGGFLLERIFASMGVLAGEDLCLPEGSCWRGSLPPWGFLLERIFASLGVLKEDLYLTVGSWRGPLPPWGFLERTT
jgi:hypothetical protein